MSYSEHAIHVTGTSPVRHFISPQHASLGYPYRATELRNEKAKIGSNTWNVHGRGVRRTYLLAFCQRASAHHIVVWVGTLLSRHCLSKRLHECLRQSTELQRAENDQ